MLSTLPTVTGLPIGLRPQEHISSDDLGVLRHGDVRALCIAIPHAREDESFADDLNMKRGIVSSRVALLLRSTEIQPAVSKIRALVAHLPLFFHPCNSSTTGERIMAHVYMITPRG